MKTKDFYRTNNYNVDHSTFGGEVTIEDFNTYLPNRKRISNQIKTSEFNKQKDEERKYRNMTLEELREMKIVSNTNGRPTSTLTNEKWQKEFNVRKMFITPYGRDLKRLGGKYSKESGMWNEETMGKYHGATNWQEYCSYINDVLKNIRAGQTEYCYFIYQIMELTKFHYNTLRTKYCDGYWEVWLEM